MSQEHHETTPKYFPATEKDHERDMIRRHYEDPIAEGIGTHTHTKRYVPAPGRGPFLGLFRKSEHHEKVKSRGQSLENQHEDVGE